MSPELFLMTLLIIKHFICDFPLQSPWMAMNKGTYGHRAGIAHVGVHMIGTFIILILFSQFTLIFFGPSSFLMVILTEAVIHYHTDWFKMWFNKKMNWTCDKSIAFWNLLGFDQLIHYITYIGIVWYLI